MSASSEQILFGIYGLAFFTLGLVMAVRSVGHHGPAIVSRMRLLAVFGLLHGVFEWLIMFGAGALFPKFTISLAAISFLPLFTFAFWSSQRLLISGIAISATLAVLWLITISLISSPPVLELIARYLIGVPAALAAGLAFLLDSSFRLRRDQTTWALKISALGFLAYGATQLVSAPVMIAGFPWVETRQFQDVTGVSVFAIRAVIAVNISVAALMLIREFETIIRRDLETQLERAKKLADQRNEELTAALELNEHYATHDHLTSIGNRRGVETFFRQHRIFEDGLAIIHIDLDDFKQINDTMGHGAGDRLLKHIASVLKSNVRAGDFVARIGGDEFIVISRSGNNETDLSNLGTRLLKVLQEPVMIDGRPCRCNVSIGIAFDKGPKFKVEQILLHADTALYRAKRTGKKRVEFFSADIQREIVEKKKLADEIFAGLESASFFPVYQLQFDAKTQMISGVEALARWRHPERGILPPDQFLDLAEELNVIEQIDSDILHQAYRDFTSWSEAGYPVPKISVNISANRLRDQSVIASVQETGFRPGTISFELVESIFLDDPDERVSENIRRLREMGVDIEIDDFGTGHASIVALMKLSPTRLKIDRALIAPITASSAQLRLVKSIVEIGLAQGISVTAEGVETMEHAEILTSLGCETLQGFALAHPMSAPDLHKFLDAKTIRQRG